MSLNKSVSKEVGLVSLKILTTILEYICRVLYLCMPLWVFMLFMNLRDKANTVNVLTTFVSKDATFQHIYPGVLLVLDDPNALEKNAKKISQRVENFLATYKYTAIATLLFLILVAIAVH